MLVAQLPSPTPTYIPLPSEHDLTPTDAPWPWPAWRAAADPTLGVVGTPLLLQSHASGLAHVGDEETIVGHAENALYSLPIGLPEHRWSALLSLCRQTTMIVELLIPASDLLEQAEEGTSPNQPTALAHDAIDAGRDRHAGLRAVNDLRRWLSLTASDVARLGGIGESTIYWWTDHPTSVPRPAKIDRLLRLQALVWGLIDDLGETITRQWFRAGHPSPLDRLLSDPGTLPDIEEEIYDWLMRRARERLAEAGSGRAVTDEDDRRDLARLTEQEHDLGEPLAVRALNVGQLEPDDLE